MVWLGVHRVAGLAVGAVRTGAWMSLTITGKLQVVVAPPWVVAVQVSVVVPTGKMEPDGGAQARTPQEPVTPGKAKVTAASQRLGSFPCVTDGQESEHAWLQQTGSAVWNERLQPPEMVPRSPPASSTTNRRHAPLGLVPLKSARAAPKGAAGAGAGKVSPVPELVGRKVPETMVVPITGAASSKVRLALIASVEPPTSDIRMIRCPAGPASRMSISPGKVWLSPEIDAVTLVTVPLIPETLML